MQKEINAEFDKEYEERRKSMLTPQDTVYEASRDYKGSDYDHFYTFFETMRGNKKIVENGTYGLRAAGAALLANISYFENRIVNWDPVNMKLI